MGGPRHARVSHIQDGRRPPFSKSINRHICVTVQPVATKIRNQSLKGNLRSSAMSILDRQVTFPAAFP